jgi:hypothetical protein
MNVTAAHSVVITEHDSRNAGDSVTALNSPEKGQFSSRNARDPIRCVICSRQFTDDETVFLAYTRTQGAWWTRFQFLPRCEAHAHTDPPYRQARHYRDARPCEFCGRSLRRQIAVRPLARLYCCERCRWRDGNRRAAWRKGGAKLATRCRQCSETFTPRRTDARFCSPACRQRAYRSRRAIFSWGASQ